MKALTVHRPWCWAIAELGKRLENRTWIPPAFVTRPGTRIALHAGKAFSAAEAEQIAAIADELNNPIPPGWAGVPPGVFATAAVIGCVHDANEAADVVAPTGQAIWFSGPLAWVLTDVVVFRERIPARGFQKLWELSSDLERLVLEAESAARADDPELP